MLWPLIRNNRQTVHATCSATNITAHAYITGVKNKSAYILVNHDHLVSAFFLLPHQLDGV